MSDHHSISANTLDAVLSMIDPCRWAPNHQVIAYLRMALLGDRRVREEANGWGLVSKRDLAVWLGCSPSKAGRLLERLVDGRVLLYRWGGGSRPNAYRFNPSVAQWRVPPSAWTVDPEKRRLRVELAARAAARPWVPTRPVGVRPEINRAITGTAMNHNGDFRLGDHPGSDRPSSPTARSQAREWTDSGSGPRDLRHADRAVGSAHTAFLGSTEPPRRNGGPARPKEEEGGYHRARAVAEVIREVTGRPLIGERFADLAAVLADVDDLAPIVEAVRGNPLLGPPGQVHMIRALVATGPPPLPAAPAAYTRADSLRARIARAQHTRYEGWEQDVEDASRELAECENGAGDDDLTEVAL